MKSSKRLRIIIFLVLFLAAAAYLVMEYTSGNLFAGSSPYESVMRETGYSIKYDFQSRVKVYSAVQPGFFYVTKDGAKYLLSDGTEKMSHTYSFTAPILVGEGDYAAVYEQNGRSLYVYTADGLAYGRQFDGSILAVSINKMGYCGVITKRDDCYDVFVCNDKGVALQKYVSTASYSFPVSTDVSDDGRILAIAFLDFGNIEVNSKIVFIYANQTESINYTDGIFASLSNNPDEYITMIKFMGKNNIMTISDKQLCLYDVENNCEKKWTYVLNNQLDSINFLGDSGFAIALGSAFRNKMPEQQGLVKIYDLSLNKTGEFLAESGSVNGLCAAFDSLMVESSNKLTALKRDGTILWTLNGLQDIKQAIFADNPSTALLLSGNSAVMYELVKEKIAEAAE